MQRKSNSGQHTGRPHLKFGEDFVRPVQKTQADDLAKVRAGLVQYERELPNAWGCQTQKCVDGCWRGVLGCVREGDRRPPEMMMMPNELPRPRIHCSLMSFREERKHIPRLRKKEDDGNPNSIIFSFFAKYSSNAPATVLKSRGRVNAGTNACVTCQKGSGKFDACVSCLVRRTISILVISGVIRSEVLVQTVSLDLWRTGCPMQSSSWWSRD